MPSNSSYGSDLNLALLSFRKHPLPLCVAGQRGGEHAGRQNRSQTGGWGVEITVTFAQEVIARWDASALRHNKVSFYTDARTRRGVAGGQAHAQS